MATSNRALIDTNVLVYAAVPTAPQHVAALALCDRAMNGHDREGFCFTSQVLFEFYATITKKVRPVSSTRDAAEDLRRYALALSVLPAPMDLTERVATLLLAVPLVGQDVFDLVLAATMLANDVHDLYTYDPRIFSQVPGITVHEP